MGVGDECDNQAGNQTISPGEDVPRESQPLEKRVLVSHQSDVPEHVDGAECPIPAQHQCSKHQTPSLELAPAGAILQRPLGLAKAFVRAADGQPDQTQIKDKHPNAQPHVDHTRKPSIFREQGIDCQCQGDGDEREPARDGEKEPYWRKVVVGAVCQELPDLVVTCCRAGKPSVRVKIWGRKEERRWAWIHGSGRRSVQQLIDSLA